MKQTIVLILVLLYSLCCSSQEIAPVTDKILIKNVSINAQPGASAYIGHILVDNGMIIDVGANIETPYDAQVIDCDSLHAYAGFIASLSHAGLKAPKEDGQRPKVDRTGYPPNDIAGITPEQGIEDGYDLKDAVISDLRKQGFTISHSVPHGRMLPGQGSIIALNGSSFNEAVIVKNKSLFAQWKTANRVFPGTIIGIMSKWRQLYRNAELALQHNSKYQANPRSKKRPDHDAAEEALWPVIQKQMPVFFKAEKHRDIYRTLQLQQDLGFHLVLAEVKDVDRALDDMDMGQSSVLLSLDLPKEEKEKSDNKEKMDEDPKMSKLKERKTQSINRYTSQAKLLADKGWPVTFSYLDTKAAHIHTNIKRLIKNGLSEKEALSALTTHPAQVIGISDIAGTIEKGKLGHLVIATKPLFDEKSKIKMVLIDGEVHKYEVKEKKKKKSTDGEASIDPSGTWAYSIEIPGMAPSGTMTITKNDDDFNIDITSNQNPGEVVTAKDIELSGSDMSFNFSMTTGGLDISVDNDLTFDGDTFEGTVSVSDFGTFDITGSRSDPK